MSLPVSVVIASKGRPLLLLETVDSLFACPDSPAEVVVVDQSKKRHPQLAATNDARIRYVQTTERGLSRARNEGARRAAHDVLVYVDDDMRATSGWLRALLDALAEDDRTVATGRVSPGDAEVANAARPSSAEGEEGAVYEGRIDTDVLAGGNVALRRSALEEVGGWDERLGPGSRFPAADDNDLGLRLLDRGYRIVYVPEAELVHRAWRSRASGLRLRWRYGRGKGGFYVKHIRAGNRAMRRRLARDLGKRARRFPHRLLHARGLAAADVLYSLGVVAGAAHWVATEEVLDTAARRLGGRRRSLVRRGGRWRREVALTFDDGPSEWTEPILELLARKGAGATFFVVGSAVDGRDALVRRIVADGHELGNHFFDHRPASELTDGEIEEELSRTRERLRAVGADTMLVRPPYGKQAARVAAIAKRLGLGPTVLWSVDPADWREGDSHTIAERVLADLHRGAIVDLHDGMPGGQRGRPDRTATVGAVARLLDELERRGYKAVTVSELLR